MTESSLVILAIVMALAAACLAARYPRNMGTGVMLGTVVGVASLFIFQTVIGFLGGVVPLGQMDFWLARVISDLL